LNWNLNQKDKKILNDYIISLAGSYWQTEQFKTSRRYFIDILIIFTYSVYLQTLSKKIIKQTHSNKVLALKFPPIQ
jgi:hypothetical protein